MTEEDGARATGTKEQRVGRGGIEIRGEHMEEEKYLEIISQKKKNCVRCTRLLVLFRIA